MATGKEIPRESISVGDTGRMLALNDYKGNIGLVVGRAYKGSFYLDFVTKELNDGRTFNIPMGINGWTSASDLASDLRELANLIDSETESTPGDQANMFEGGDNSSTDVPDDDIPF